MNQIHLKHLKQSESWTPVRKDLLLQDWLIQWSGLDR